MQLPVAVAVVLLDAGELAAVLVVAPDTVAVRWIVEWLIIFGGLLNIRDRLAAPPALSSACISLA